MNERVHHMSKDLEKSAVELERRAEGQVARIRRVVREYNEIIQNSVASDSNDQIRKQREIERVVGESIQLNKALKRLRKKMRIGK